MKTMKTTARFPLFTTPATMLAMLTAPFAVIAANTFTAASGDWNTAANWSEGVPVAGEAVVIDGNATLTNATPALSSMTVNAGKTLTFDGWDTLLTATTVTIAGTVTHAQNSDTNAVDGWTPSARVNIACSTLEVTADGKIDVNYRGYLGGQTANKDGHGPGRGRGRGTDSSDGGAGGYGGAGGTAFKSGFMNYGLTYGSSTLPEDPGSGGGSGNTDAADGGAGGGSVRIVATGTVAVNGQILANGGTGPGYGGAGSGGGVYIDCLALTGSGGVVSAIGGNGASRSGGGGGGVEADLGRDLHRGVVELHEDVLLGGGGDAEGHLGADAAGLVGAGELDAGHGAAGIGDVGLRRRERVEIGVVRVAAELAAAGHLGEEAADAAVDLGVHRDRLVLFAQVDADEGDARERPRQHGAGGEAVAVLDLEPGGRLGDVRIEKAEARVGAEPLHAGVVGAGYDHGWFPVMLVSGVPDDAMNCSTDPVGLSTATA